MPAITATIAVLNAATLESVGLDHKHRPPISRARRGSVPVEARLSLPGVLFDGSQLGAIECGIHRRGPARIYLIQTLGDCIPLLPVQELRNRRGVQLTPGNAEAACGSVRQTEKVVGYRDGSLHARSITWLYPIRLTPEPTVRATKRIVRRDETFCPLISLFNVDALRVALLLASNGSSPLR